MKSTVTLFALAIATSAANAGCWNVGALRGVAALKGDSYKIDPDGFGQYAPALFIVSTEGGGSVSGHGDFHCMTMTPSAVMCVGGGAGQMTLEVWSVDEARGVAVFTRARSGFGEFDGSSLFVGKVIGRCKP